MNFLKNIDFSWLTRQRIAALAFTLVGFLAIIMPMCMGGSKPIPELVPYAGLYTVVEMTKDGKKITGDELEENNITPDTCAIQLYDYGDFLFAVNGIGLSGRYSVENGVITMLKENYYVSDSWTAVPSEEPPLTGTANGEKMTIKYEDLILVFTKMEQTEQTK